MQFYLNGYATGDPEVEDASEKVLEHGGKDPLPEECDVLIVGCGPAGLTLAAQLAKFPEIKTCIVDQKSGPLERGQADGAACRTLEMFQAFGFVERVLREAYWVNETTFWKSSEANSKEISRSGWVKDTEEGLSEFPHVIINQARVHEFYLDIMRKSSSKLTPYYGRELIDLEVNSEGSHPVSASFHRDGETKEHIKAKYVVGCDGARSSVRGSLGYQLKGDSANKAWGVMDILAVTDFPDIRFKSIINSTEEGSIVLIPREGGYLTRFYVEMDSLKSDERVSNRNLDIDDIIAGAQRILHPHTLDVKEVAWWSVYEIGQRLCDRFDDVSDDEVESRNPHVFIAGDACHTHSPKAGQGMNVSMQDTFNLGWKLVSVLKGRCPPELLRTYSSERQAVAKELINFDKEWAAMLSAASKPGGEERDPAEVQSYFVRSGRYTAGTATRYKPSVLTGKLTYQHLAKGFTIGKRFHSAPVVRVADAKLFHMGHAVRADGRWRIFAFAGANDKGQEGSGTRNLCQFLEENPASPILRYTESGADSDSLIDVRAVYQCHHRELVDEALPELLLPLKGRLGLKDYEKVFSAELESGQDIFEQREIDRTKGCMVIIRPDQYVANILPLAAHEELAAFFDRIFVPPK